MVKQNLNPKKPDDLTLKSRRLSGCLFKSLEFAGKPIVKTIVNGMIANVTPTTVTGRKRLQDWKRKVAKEIFVNRNKIQNPDDWYAITVGMIFHTPTHGEQKLDLDNYLKPILDSIAAGLFSDESVNFAKITNYNKFDDSNFRYLYVERMKDAKLENEEGILIYVTKKPHR